MDALEAVLKGHGFEVVKLTDEKAGKDDVEGRFAKLLAGDGDRKKALGRGDVLLVAVCSHGFTFEVEDPATKAKRQEPFVAGYDAVPNKPADMIALNGLIDAAKDYGATKLFLVDACREETDPNRGRARGIEGTQVTLPPRTAVLFSCGKGQLSHQPDALKHGLFTFAVLKALKGDSGLSGEVTWSDLVSNVGKSFRTPEFAKHIPPGREQRPVDTKGEFEDLPLLTIGRAAAKSPPDPPAEMAKGDDPVAGAERSFEVADGTKMEFCWMPMGEAQLGSPKAEREQVSRLRKAALEPEWLASEQDALRGKFTTAGFWLGKYEVTQVEWFKVIGKNPSGFTTQTLAKGLDTLRFPVEKVNWNECQEFVKKLNARPGASKAFGKPGKFTLPHENEWEYACRGGKGNAQPFYWGSELNGTQANCFGDRPYGTATPGRNLRRPCPVEDDNAGRYERHPWGLHHMLGNVWEWCENKYKQSGYAYAIRGGAWNNYAYECRAAVRNDRAPNSSNEDCGLRIAFRPD